MLGKQSKRQNKLQVEKKYNLIFFFKKQLKEIKIKIQSNLNDTFSRADTRGRRL